MKKEKMLFFDLDGTIMKSISECDPHVLELIPRLRENGCKCFICTSRGDIAIPEELRRAMDGMITLCGGHVYVGGALIYDGFLPTAHSSEVIRFCSERRVPLLSEGGDNIAMIGYDEWRASPAEKEMLPYVTHFFDGAEAFFAGDIDQRVYKFSVYEEYLNVVRQCPLVAGGTLTCVNAALGWHEIMGDFSKGDGIRRVVGHLGAGLEDAICFGDSENDLPMFDVCGQGVAVENALDCVKRRADYVASEPGGPGIEQALRHFGLI